MRGGNPGLLPKFQLFSTSTTPATGPSYQILWDPGFRCTSSSISNPLPYQVPGGQHAKTAERFQLGDRTSTTATTSHIERTHHARHARPLSTSSHTWVLSCTKFGAMLPSISALAPTFWTAELEVLLLSEQGNGVSKMEGEQQQARTAILTARQGHQSFAAAISSAAEIAAGPCASGPPLACSPSPSIAKRCRSSHSLTLSPYFFVP